MKKNLGVVAAALLLAACGGQKSTSTDALRTGSVQGSARFSVDAASADTMQFNLTCDSGVSGASMTDTDPSNGWTYLFSNLPDGAQCIVTAAAMASGAQIGTGSASVTVHGGVTAPANINVFDTRVVQQSGTVPLETSAVASAANVVVPTDLSTYSGASGPTEVVVTATFAEYEPPADKSLYHVAWADTCGGSFTAVSVDAADSSGHDVITAKGTYHPRAFTTGADPKATCDLTATADVDGATNSKYSIALVTLEVDYLGSVSGQATVIKAPTFTWASLYNTLASDWCELDPAQPYETTNASCATITTPRVVHLYAAFDRPAGVTAAAKGTVDCGGGQWNVTEHEGAVVVADGSLGGTPASSYADVSFDFFGRAGQACALTLTVTFTDANGGTGSNSTTLPVSFKVSTDLSYLFDARFPYMGQTLGVLSYTGELTPTFATVIQHLSRSTNAVWNPPTIGAWDGDDSEVHLSAFIQSGWGAKTAENWYPRISTAISKLASDTSATYWPRASMNADLVQYWRDQGITKIYYPGSNTTSLSDDFYLYYPNGADQDTAGSYPLMILFHGGGEAALQTETFGFLPIAAKEKFFVFAPETNNGALNGSTDTALAQVLAQFPQIDRTRIYVVGSSMGGSTASVYALNHTTTVAAAGVMDQPLSLATIGNRTPTAQQIANVQAHGLPTVYLGGTACMYALWNAHNSAYFYAHEGASPSTAAGSFPDYLSGFNQLMQAYGLNGRLALTSVAERVNNAATATTPSFTYWTGYPVDQSTTLTQYGTNVYKATFTGQEQLVAYVVENRPHMPSGYDAQLIWDYISQWARDLSTGQSVKR